MAPYNYEFFEITFPAQYVAHVEINRPQKLNAFKEPMWTNLGLMFQQLSTDENVRCVVLSGRGEKAFTAGLDVEASGLGDQDKGDIARTAFQLKRHIQHYQDSVTPIEKCSKPVICVFHGYSYGAAIDIATACDIRICAEGTKFCVKEVDIGLAADVGTLTRLPKTGVSMSWIKDICYTARVFDPAEALRMGFISTVSPSKDAAIKAAVEKAVLISSKSPVAVQGTKALIEYSKDHSTEDGLNYTTVWNSAMLQTDDVKKAMLSGLRKTKVTFEKL